MLIITYYWPPSGGVGVQRWLKFSKYLPDNNWSPIIYTPENPNYDLIDNSLEEDLPKNIQVIKKPIWEPFALYQKLFGKKGATTRSGIVSEGKHSSILKRLSIWVRGNLMLPDPRVFWVKPSIRFLKQYIKENDIDVVVTNGPPHSVHLIGLGLKKRLGIKWVADFRDPWSYWDLLPRLKTSSLAMRYHRRKERQVMSTCDGMIVVSLGMKDLYSSLNPNIRAINNGFDGDPIRIASFPNKFRICHVGLLNEIKNPEQLWKVLSDLCRENGDFADDLEICLAGTISQYIVDQLNTLLPGKLKALGYISHQEAYQVYTDSSLMLLLMNKTDNAGWIIPAKLYEYLQVGKNILALGTTETDANTILTDMGHHPFIDFDDIEQIKRQIMAHYESFKSGQAPEQNPAVNRYSREKLTQELATFLNEIVA